MKKISKIIIVVLLSLFIFTGCYSKQSKTEIVKERETKIVMPTDDHYEYFPVPTMSNNFDKTEEEIIDDLIVYSTKLQTTIMLYEGRTDSLKKWKDDMLKIHSTGK